MNTTLAPADPVVAHHLVGGSPVLPAAAQVDLLLTTLDARRPDRTWQLDQVSFLAPVRVVDPVELRVVEDDRVTALASGAVRHCQAVVADRPLPPPTYVDTAEMRAGCSEAVPLAELAAWRASSGIEYGSTYQAIRSLHRGTDRVLALVSSGDAPGGFIPAAVLDSAFQCLGLLDGGASGACLPWVVGRISARRHVRGTVLVLVERTGSRAGLVRGRATVCNLQGEVLVTLERITLKGAPGSPGRIATTRWSTVVPMPSEGEPVVVTPEESVQALFARVRELAVQRPMPDLVFVTQRGQDVFGEDIDPVHAAAWGLVRTLRLEHPRTRIRLVDGPIDGAVWFDEPELAYRDGQWFAPSHEPVAVASARRSYTGGRFLITGGMGGLGLLVAEALAAAGAAHLTLVGRRVPEEPRLDRLATRCDVRTLAVDVRSLPDLGPFDGIFHAAGVLRDGLARTLTSERIAEVLAPKVDGVHALGRASDFVALFSSISAVHGNLGQSSYAAANAYLDGYAASRRARGEPWYSLNWGLWAAGMGSHVAEGAARRGIPALTAEDGIALLHNALALPPGNYSLTAREPATTEPREETMTTTPIAPSSTSGLWPALSAIMCRTLHVDSITPEDDLLELGLDSMMAVEVAAALAGEGVELDPATLFDHTNVGALLAHLTELAPAHAALPPVLTPPATLPLPAAAAAPAYAANGVTSPPVQAPPTPPFPVLPAAAARPVLTTTQAATSPAQAPSVTPATAAAPIYVTTEMTAPPVFTSPPQAPPTTPPLPATPAAPAYITNDVTPSVLTSVPGATSPAQALLVTPAAAAAPVHITAEVTPPAAFVPDWDRFRDTSAPVPTVPAPRTHAAEPRPAARTTATPRRTLPTRLSDVPGGSFLDRRIDALSVDDRAIVARGDYFYEPVIEAAEGSQIKVEGRWLLNFASYSYLGLIRHAYVDQAAERAVRDHGTGAHGVRLLAGTLHLHRELELTIARFLGTEDAVIYTSGYMSNVATVAALVGPGDHVIGDVHNHASILDGYRLSGANVTSYAHNDLADLERALRKAGTAGKLVITDAVFSMDGDVADIPGISDLCHRYDAALMVDEAHSIGVLGNTGRGVVEHFGLDPAAVPIRMGTLSKTIPSTGGYVAGSADLVFALKNNARGWMFSAAGTPPQVAAAKAAFEVIETAPELVSALRTRTDRYRSALRELGFDTMGSTTPVVPIRCRDTTQAHEMARLSQRNGVFTQPITYPTVPKTLPRLRTIVTLNHTDAELDQAIAVLAAAGRTVGLI
ncbi:glycine C-acetyltransferase [Actinokineospora baliensis]|uniref:bifunctional SDR family oxidoreductase/pyridoxal phosphate-dependent aminotransferase family protein n=1 Tax=Actinokineospora baliensis TaxID=547056 RepID=UPI00195A4B59|nr:bifunctional SDR family oxidoreductase/pyridoxal phosphate-dependent aminotransferase family protein [Actinokineospora baliensis]MBM7774800.1 glycine C-acetyltransferase [Actinokineospora baliensis]